MGSDPLAPDPGWKDQLDTALNAFKTTFLPGEAASKVANITTNIFENPATKAAVEDFKGVAVGASNAAYNAVSSVGASVANAPSAIGRGIGNFFSSALNPLNGLLTKTIIILVVVGVLFLFITEFAKGAAAKVVA